MSGAGDEEHGHSHSGHGHDCSRDHGHEGGHDHGHGHALAAPDDAAAPAADVVPAGVSETKESEPKASDIFMLARQCNFPLALKLLAGYPHHWLAVDEDGHSMLHWGALVGNVEFIQHAIKAGVNVNAPATNLQTPLMWAVLRGWVPASRCLLDGKATLQVKDSLGATPLMIAVQHRQYAAMLLLLHRGKDMDLLGDADKNGCTTAHWASYKGDLTALKFLEYFDADLHRLDNSKMLPLHRAVSNSQAHVVEFLVEKGSDIMQKNADGNNCFEISEKSQDANMQAVLKRLLKKRKGNDVDAGDLESGAASEGSPEKQEKRSTKEALMEMMKDRAAQKAFPVFWLVCVSMATFQYLMDLRSTSYTVAPTASFLFEVGVPLSLAIFAYTALSDPGKVPSRTRGASGVEELMRQIDSDHSDGHVPDIGRLCTTTWVLKGLRTKYCTQTGACVEEFDHYCIWLNCAIGKGNHRPFCVLALTEFMTQLCHLTLCWNMARELVAYESIGSWIFGVLTGYPLLALIFFVHCLTCPWVLMLMVHQGRLISMNLTTNEMLNAGRYEHFWTTVPKGGNTVVREYRNPFNKGSALKNILDFWWFQKRAEMGPSMSKDGGHGHSHAHGHSDKACCNHHH
eukprot:gnl/TRDRNA2_/TRDRNA2_85451_c0_seq4.p1 gnl/TRDRNA2_/TRDRNA2_85451_c0~~gnl/TRDRNA2_/TRDRNA2_85451_c0_seq4.p1  ORF type:complete len:639 (-),score=116.20 gnl/TRDRNA2_/TRDRNA2_85451_c0_seq4:41-1921(-)